MRKLCTFALAFSAAVFFAVYLLPESALPPAGFLCALAGAASLPLLRGNLRLRAALIAFGLSAGLLWTASYSIRFLTPADRLDGQTLAVSATVADYPRTASYGVSVLVRLETDGPELKTILYADERYAGLLPGDRIAGTVSLRRADMLYGRENTYYASGGVYLTGSLRGDLTVTSPSRRPLRTWPAAVSRALKERIAAVFPSDTAPFAAALVTGDKDGLPGSLYTAFQRAGLAHVVAVSGLHVSFLSGLIASLLRNRRRLSALVSICLLFFFAAVVGNTPSVLRAVFLQCFLLIAPLTGREDDKATSLSFALMLLLLWNPFAAAGVSLQLSFAAVAGIYLVAAPLRTRFLSRLSRTLNTLAGRLRHRAAVFLLSTLATTLGALVFTTPLTAYYFGSISLVSPLTNLLTLWAVSFAFIGVLAAALLALVLPALAWPLAWAVSLLLRYAAEVSGALASLPFASVAADHLYLRLWLLAVYVILLLWLCRPIRMGGGRPIFPVCCCTVLLCAALFFNAAELTAGALTISVLDVGQGQSILFRAGDTLALVDCGGNGMRNAGDIAADAVQRLGRSQLDLLILTHCHTDHAGGVPQLLERLDVRTLILPDVDPEDTLRREIVALAETQGTEVLYLTDDYTLPFGTATLQLYAPLGDGGTNEEGLSVLCTAGDFDALITGDMNQTVERRLVKYGNLPDIELLVAGHHGSKYAVSEELLLAVRPETAAISVGYNTYGHPAAETLERLGAAGCDIYRTDLMGTVIFTIEN